MPRFKVDFELNLERSVYVTADNRDEASAIARELIMDEDFEVWNPGIYFEPDLAGITELAEDVTP